MCTRTAALATRTVIFPIILITAGEAAGAGDTEKAGVTSKRQDSGRVWSENCREAEMKKKPPPGIWIHPDEWPPLFVVWLLLGRRGGAGSYKSSTMGATIALD